MFSEVVSNRTEASASVIQCDITGIAELGVALLMAYVVGMHCSNASSVASSIDLLLTRTSKSEGFSTCDSLPYRYFSEHMSA